MEQQKIQPQINQKKSCFNLRNCCLGCFAIFILLLIILLILLTLSGLAIIPLLSPILYGNGPSPTRVVAPETIDDKYFENLFKNTADKNQTQVIINENVLSYLMNEFVNKENNTLVSEEERTSGSQIALEESSAELFIKPRKPKTTLTIDVIPTEDKFKAKKFKVGKLRMPVFILNMLFSQYLDTDSLYSAGIKSIKLEKGNIILNIDPTFFQNNQKEAPVPFIPE